MSSSTMAGHATGSVDGAPLLRSAVSGDGARLEFSTRGGQVCSWKTPDGVERLFMSPLASWQAGVAIRGGIPVIFPQFANEGPFPKHGFARLCEWELAEQTVLPSGAGRVELRLADSEETRRSWPHPFQLVLRATFQGLALITSLSVRNTGERAFDFTCALHTYLSARVPEAVVQGLQGLRFLDSADRRRLAVHDEELLRFDREIDRFFFGVTGPVELRQGSATLRVRQEGFKDVVVWNPWRELSRKLPDLPDDGYERFVCIESATVERPVSLAPGAEWFASQQLIAG